MLPVKDGEDFAYIDGAGGHGQIVTRREDVQELALLFNILQGGALSARESACLVREIMEEA